MNSLRRLKLKGFKSIKEMDLELRPLNVLIGANGAGKSNLISYFKLLNEMMAGRLRLHVAKSGSANSLLYFGAKITKQIDAKLEFKTDQGLNYYRQILIDTVDDALVFAEETLDFRRHGFTGQHNPPLPLGVGHQESRVPEMADSGNTTARVFRHLLNECRVYHFHDTSPTAGVRRHCYEGDGWRLRAEANNLAAFLLRLRDTNPNIAYQRIISTIRLIAPYFRDFDLRPAQGKVILNWLDETNNEYSGSSSAGLDEYSDTSSAGLEDQMFGPHQLSDGTLRAMCLIALLLQPIEELPSLIIVDEPELGLHPYALGVIASLFKKAARHTQVLVSTQSTAFLDHFEPDDVIVVDRKESQSVFRRLDKEELAGWLEDYTLSGLWEKGVLGGGPH